MSFDLNPQSLKKLCKDLKLYASCPELNEVLYLHQRGIVKLKNLDAYTGLRTLHLECNAVSIIEGLENCVDLRCLYLNQLNYLDDSPVFEKERRLAQAWCAGGTEAEKIMRETIRLEEANAREGHRKAFEDMIARAKSQDSTITDATSRQCNFLHDLQANVEDVPEEKRDHKDVIKEDDNQLVFKKENHKTGEEDTQITAFEDMIARAKSQDSTMTDATNHQCNFLHELQDNEEDVPEEKHDQKDVIKEDDNKLVFKEENHKTRQESAKTTGKHSITLDEIYYDRNRHGERENAININSQNTTYIEHALNQTMDLEGKKGNCCFTHVHDSILPRKLSKHSEDCANREEVIHMGLEHNQEKIIQAPCSANGSDVNVSLRPQAGEAADGTIAVNELESQKNEIDMIDFSTEYEMCASAMNHEQFELNYEQTQDTLSKFECGVDHTEQALKSCVQSSFKKIWINGMSFEDSDDDKDECGVGDEDEAEVEVKESDSQSTRPMIWGSKKYRDLWTKAASIEDAPTLRGEPAEFMEDVLMSIVAGSDVTGEEMDENRDAERDENQDEHEILRFRGWKDEPGKKRCL